LEKLLKSNILEYKSLALFFARNHPTDEFNKEIFNIFHDESNAINMRIGAMYHLVANSYVKLEDRNQFLLFCEKNTDAVEDSARRYYGKTVRTSDTEMLDRIADRLRDQKYYSSRFLHLNNLKFIKDNEITNIALELATEFLKDDDDIVRETAFKIKAILE